MPRVIEGNDLGLSGSLSLGPPFAGSELSVGERHESGRRRRLGVAERRRTGSPAVAVREDFPGGAVQTGLVSGGAGGPIGELAVGRSGLGDGLVAFRQGPLGNAAIVAAQVTAPPEQFVVSVPNGWVTPSRAAVSWLPATSANGPLRYRLVLDGRPLATPPGAFELHLDPRGLGSGPHRVQVLATDIDGQATLTPPSTLQVDGVPPTVSVKPARGGRAVIVRVGDAYSGVNTHAVRVSFGDGQSARGRARFTHRYARAGVYQVVVHVRDKLGNQGVVRRLVSAR